VVLTCVCCLAVAAGYAFPAELLLLLPLLSLG
jgi:hypothetical protein